MRTTTPGLGGPEVGVLGLPDNADAVGLRSRHRSILQSPKATRGPYNAKLLDHSYDLGFTIRGSASGPQTAAVPESGRSTLGTASWEVNNK
ncbi:MULTISPECIES: hypothetical protein [Streptomyces]|uniref:Uncharacterized protein n=1 Tax=Streptomyces caniscabiei TaxID=2746961 RepID=A0ABU4N4S3_9ACTN|nr:MULTISPECIES: hypothetical protein [Streptomyces]MBE4739583.1 hypothetical protein [Streptomyces caniscabiei]MBE4762260.1 hypothetical protein [Streptomyces caniscabiei]MBE4773570.1 hypothetical protein [Streptomyces caniscabiei]MBE4782737.1 hypothetical protein [Streptomyces caniscabiei]MBE4792040.1 hypothetical protein [Streptomyces caniscabiei]